MKRSQEQIAAELDALRELRDKIPQTNFFDESNLDKVDTAVEVLDENLDTDDCYNRENDEGWDLDAALEATYWRDGDEDESPSSGWAPLIK